MLGSPRQAGSLDSFRWTTRNGQARLTPHKKDYHSIVLILSKTLRSSSGVSKGYTEKGQKQDKNEVNQCEDR